MRENNFNFFSNELLQQLLPNAVEVLNLNERLALGALGEKETLASLFRKARPFKDKCFITYEVA